MPPHALLCLPVGGLSSDPATRERQLAALAAGRQIARARRQAGLPTKRRQQAGDEGGAGSRIVPGAYPARAGSGASAAGSSRPTSTRGGTRGGNGDDAGRRREPQRPELGTLGRWYARILGYRVDD